MRTFHTGGVAGGGDITQGLPRVEEVFEARPPKKRALLAEVAGVVSIEEQARTISGPKGKSIVAKTSFGQRVLKITYKDLQEKDLVVPEGAKVKVKDGELVKEGDVIFVTAEKVKVKSEHFGQVTINGDKIKIYNDSERAKEYLIAPGTVLWVKDGDVVETGASIDGRSC